MTFLGNVREPPLIELEPEAARAYATIFMHVSLPKRVYSASLLLENAWAAKAQKDDVLSAQYILESS